MTTGKRYSVTSVRVAAVRRIKRGLRMVVPVLLLLFAWVQVLAAAEPVHPHLLFTSEELPVLRERIQRGTPKRAWFFMRERCGKHLQLRELPASSDLDAPTLDPLSELALAWQLSEGEEYKAKFLALLGAAREAETDLEALHYDTALIFDWGYGIMSAADREYLKGFLVSGMKPQEDAWKTLWYPFSNWGLIPGMRGLRQAAALHGHPEYDPRLLEKAAELVRDILTCFIDDAGYPAEGGDYLNYPFVRIGGASMIILTRKGFDLVTGTNLPKVPYYQLAAGVPRGALPTYLPFGDSGYSVVGAYALRSLLYLMPENPLLHRVAALAEVEWEHKPDPLSGILYHVPVAELAEEEPEVARSTFNPEAGIVTYKSGMEPEAFYVASFTRQSRGHAHEDVGTFIVRAFGVTWLTDPGYGEGPLMLHNMVAIDNGGPESNGAPGDIRQVVLAPSSVMVSSDLTGFWNQWKVGSQGDPLQYAAWPVQFARRSLLVMPANKELKTPAYGIVSDYVRRDDQNRLYSQLFQTERDKEIVLSGRGAELRREGSQLRLEVLEPAEGVIGTDEWESHGRFPGAKYSRVKVDVTGRYGRFVTLFHPSREGMAPLKMQPVRGQAKWQIDWSVEGEGVVDYLDYSLPTNHNSARGGGPSPYLGPYELLLWRLRAGEPATAEPAAYTIVNATTAVVLQGSRELVRIMAGYSDEGAPRGIIFSAVYGDDTLHLDVYNHPLNTRQLRQLVRIQAFAPAARRVWVNGIEREFERNGSTISVAADSRLLDEYKLISDAKWERLIRRQEELRGHRPSSPVVQQGEGR